MKTIIGLFKKKFHKHNWVYYNYTPYTNKHIPHGAEYRKCETCGIEQAEW